MMPSTLPLFLVVVWLSISGSLQTDPAPIFSSNVTSLEVGKSARLRCQLDNFSPGNDYYYVYFFYRDNSGFCQYYITVPDSSGHRSTTFSNQAHHHLTLGRHSLSSTFPVYEITVASTVVGSGQYYCSLHHNQESVYSNRLSLTVTPPPPSAILTSTVPSPLLERPFTLTCTFAHFTTPLVNYTVQFLSSRDGPLAHFEVAYGKVLISDVLHSQVEVLPGPKSVFPTFHLVLTEKVDNTSVYWCGLVEAGKAQVTSQPWPILVKFTASKSSENQRLGTCAVGVTGLDLSGKAYSVQFLSDLGPKAVNLLGEYIFRPNLFDEFKFNPLPPWTSLRHGLSTSWPEFSILATGTGTLHGTWWCVLAIGAKGTPNYREITSEKATL